MKIGFFGGSFNPPTIAHLDLVKKAIQKYQLDKVYFVPVNNFYPKEDLLDIRQRINMLEIICSQETKISVSDIEVENDRLLKAIDIFEIIEKKFQGNDIYFLMGEDNYLKMSSWSNYEKLLKYKYIVFQRKRESSINKENVLYINSVENLNISSSIIREKIKNNESIADLVTSDIEKYIKENKLYIKNIEEKQ